MSLDDWFLQVLWSSLPELTPADGAKLESDRALMRRCIALACRALGQTAPNPR